jgi:hypothetical protein
MDPQDHSTAGGISDEMVKRWLEIYGSAITDETVQRLAALSGSDCRDLMTKARRDAILSRVLKRINSLGDKE